MRLLSGIVVGILLLFAACKADGPCDTCPETLAPVCGDDGIPYKNSCEAMCAGVGYQEGFCEEEADALILDFGAQGADVCGYLLLVGTKYYHPVELDSVWYGDSIPVHIHFKRSLHLFHCGISALPYSVLELLSVDPL